MRKVKFFVSTIVNYGIHPNLSEKKKKRVRITNILALSTIFLVIPLYFVFKKIDADFLKNMILAVIVYEIMILILNKKGFINLSRFIAPNGNALIIFIYSLSLGPETYYYFFYFPAISGSFLYFELKEKKFYAFQLSFTSILIYLDLFSEVNFFPIVKLSSANATLTSYFMIPAAFLLFLICLFVLAIESEFAEESLERSRKKAELATKAKSEFLAKMSHEIRSPMNAIIGFAHLILDTELSVKQQDYVIKIKRSSQKLLMIINDILDFSKIEAKKLKIENINFNLQAIFDSLYSALSLKASKKDIELLFKLDKKIPKIISGDSLRLEQILTNLTDNAVKFTETGSVMISTKLIEANRNNVRIRFSVKDEGIGMTPEQLSNLFRSFHQIDNSITRRFGGTGLGLVIAKQLVELMGGHLNVESEADKGTLFFFEISFGIGEDIDNYESNKKTLDYFHNAKVLLVEDNSLNRQVISELIEQMGLEYDLAVNGREGYQMCCKNKYDLVLMDIQMPEMDGLTATKLIREHGLKDLPIIALTAHAMTSDKEKSLQAGMNDHLTKPIDPEELSRMVLKFIQPDKNHGKSDKKSHTKDSKQFKFVIPVIEGLDVNAGLGRLRGAKELYFKLLKEYVKLYKNAEKTIKQMIENNDIGKATHLIHSLKGASSTVGMTNIPIIASNIERYLIDGNILKALETLSEKEHCLITIINNIENYFLKYEIADVGKSVYNKNDSLDIFKVTETIQRFIELCNSGNAEALDVAKQLHQMFIEKKHKDIILKVIELVEDVEFVEAAELINKILIDLKE